MDLFEAYKAIVTANGAIDSSHVKAMFIGIAAKNKIPFAARNGRLIVSGPKSDLASPADVIIEYFRKERKMDIISIMNLLDEIGVSFNYDGDEIYSVGAGGDVSNEFVVVPPSHDGEESQKRVSNQGSESNKPKRVRSESTHKKTVELHSYEYLVDPDVMKPLTTIKHMFPDYNFVFDGSGKYSSSRDDVFNAIQFIYSDHVSYPEGKNCVRVGILDDDEDIPQFMKDAKCYMYLRYDYVKCVFVNSSSGEMEKFKKLLSLPKSSSFALANGDYSYHNKS